jgi:hypothetical protein
MIRDLTVFQVVTGIWSPRDERWSWLVADEFETNGEALRFARSLKDPTATVLRVTSSVLWRASEPPFPLPLWARQGATLNPQTEISE